jgi:hypothetical protein
VEVLGEPIGWQDMYVAAYGGIVAIEIAKDGTVNTTRLPVAHDVVERLEGEVMRFYTGIKRSAGEVLRDQSRALVEGYRRQWRRGAFGPCIPDDSGQVGYAMDGPAVGSADPRNHQCLWGHAPGHTPFFCRIVLEGDLQ